MFCKRLKKLQMRLLPTMPKKPQPKQSNFTPNCKLKTVTGQMTMEVSLLNIFTILRANVFDARFTSFRQLKINNFRTYFYLLYCRYRTPKRTQIRNDQIFDQSTTSRWRLGIVTLSFQTHEIRHVESHSTIFGTALNYVAIRILGMDKDHQVATKARNFLRTNGNNFKPSFCYYYFRMNRFAGVQTRDSRFCLE
jgi:hypothetical protein